MTKVLVGAANWHAQQWATDYYPDDLPTEWQLSFYANEFSTTFISCDDLDDPVRLAQLSEALAECHSGFRPVLGISQADIATGRVSRFFKWLASMDEEIGVQRLAGVLLMLETAEDAAEVSRACRESIPPDLPVALDAEIDHNQEADGWMDELNVSRIWQPGQRKHGCARSWLLKISLAANERSLAAQLREFLATISGDAPACVIATQGYEDITTLRKLATIIELIKG